MTYGFLGVGALTAAIVTGLCEALEDPPRILLSPRGRVISADLAARYSSVSVATDNQAVVDGSDVVLVAVLPQQAEALLAELDFTSDQLVVSLVAGLAVERLAAWVAPASRVARANPLPAAAARQSVTAVHPAEPDVAALFARLGRVVELDDAATYDALTAASATVSAHYAFLGAIAQWLVEQGVDDADARGYVAATFAGVADSLRNDPRGDAPDLDALSTEVATPGGLNEQFTRDLREAAVYDVVATALSGVLSAVRVTTVAPN